MAEENMLASQILLDDDDNQQYHTGRRQFNGKSNNPGPGVNNYNNYQMQGGKNFKNRNQNNRSGNWKNNQSTEWNPQKVKNVRNFPTPIVEAEQFVTHSQPQTWGQDYTMQDPNLWDPNNGNYMYSNIQHMNPWAMQQAAASAMVSMGKDPMNPQHWMQMVSASTDGGNQQWNQQQQQQQQNNFVPNNNFNEGGNRQGQNQIQQSGYNQNNQNRQFNKKGLNNPINNIRNNNQQRNSNNFRKSQNQNNDGQQNQQNQNQNQQGKKPKVKKKDMEEEETPIPQNCCVLLREFRTKNKKLELQDIKHNILEFAKDMFGSRLIQTKLETASEEDKDMIEAAVIQDFRVLSADVFGNYVVQKMFEYGNESHIKSLADQLVGSVHKQSFHEYGCRVIQKALECVSIEQQTVLVGELKAHVIALVEDANGNHVIQKCIERMPPEKVQFIVNAFKAKGVVQRMAMHCFGCRVLQRLIEHCDGAQIAPILDEISRYIPQLAQDQYGNYVVQHMLELGRANDRRLIFDVVRQQILMLSCHKFASNIVEKAFLQSTEGERTPIVQAIVGEPADVNPALLTMMRDRYGNYIVQRLLELVTGEHKRQLLWRLKGQLHVLKKFIYGKHIVLFLESEEANAAVAGGPVAAPISIIPQSQ